MSEDELIAALQAADGYGAMHIVIGDGNIEDDHLRHCLDDPTITKEERRLAEALLAMSEDERELAFCASDIEPVWWSDE